jgi:UDP-glucuronate 4-epimerase
MATSYAAMFKLPLTGLRYFTVYGPWGRPDMALFMFTKAILNDEEIPVFNNGDMYRNFSYIDDIVSGTLSCVLSQRESGDHKIYNLGNNKSETLMEYIQTIEKTLGKKAKIRFEPMQNGDVKGTVADISETVMDYEFNPKTDIVEGIPNFIKWYLDYYKK